VIRAGLARALKLFAGAALASGAVALVLGLALGSGAARSVSLGWYCAGDFAVLSGFVASRRGATRSAAAGAWMPVSLRARPLRWASRAEQEESLGLSAVLVVLGLVLIVLGVVIDPRHPLF
jgi:hypothetical protein